MSQSDRQRWERRHAGRRGALKVPEPFLVTHLAELRPGRVLDVACGDGRHAVYLAQQGFEVTGVDISERGLERLRCHAAAAGVAVETHQVDLDEPSSLVDLGLFDDVIIARFKPPPALWSRLVEVLVPRGRLLIATFGAHHNRHGRPLRREHRLSPGELLEVHPELALEVQEAGEVIDGYLFVRRDPITG